MESNPTCAFCEQEEAISKCEECDMLVGRHCTASHANIPATKNHVIRQLSDVIHKNQQGLKATYENMNKTAKQYEKTMASWISNICVIEYESSKVQREIKVREDALIKDVKEHFDELRIQTQEAENREKEKANEHMAQLKSKYDNFLSQRDEIKQSFEQKNVKVLSNQRAIDQLIKTANVESNSLKSAIQLQPSKTFPISFASKTAPVKDWLQNLRLVDNPDHMTSPKTKAPPSASATMGIGKGEKNTSFLCANAPISKRKTPEFCFRKLLDENSSPTECYTFKKPMASMAFIGGDIWCMNEDGIQVLEVEMKNATVKYKQNLTVHSLEKTSWGTTLKTEYNVNRVAQGTTFDAIIAACDAVTSGFHSLEPTLGLFEIDEQGRVLSIVAQGQYFDVCVENDCVYGLSNEGDLHLYYSVKNYIPKPSCITVHRKEDPGDQWSVVKSISLAEEYSSFCVANHKVTLSGIQFTRFQDGARSFHDLISWYDLGLYKQYIISKTNQHITDSRPNGKPDKKVLCSDSEGNVLISDPRTTLIQILENENKWKSASIGRLVNNRRSDLRDAEYVISGPHRRLWLLWSQNLYFISDKSASTGEDIVTK